MDIYKTIGLMSGTSLDGLDIAYCVFRTDGIKWEYEIRHAETLPYDQDWQKRLSTIMSVSSVELMKTHVELGKLHGNGVAEFMKKYSLNPDLIASHGHTVFHQPEKGFTLQISSGYEIMKSCRKKVVCDFRSLDITLGGQGAPLVPVGDKLLFADFDYCLNLGGISNISFDQQQTRIAYDIAPNNIVLNKLANELGHDYDPEGSIAKTGILRKDLLDTLNQLDYYSLPFPKSLGMEYIMKEVFPIIDDSGYSIEDKLCTFNHHIAFQINQEIIKSLSGKSDHSLFLTGGGAFNSYFVKLLKEYAQARYNIHLPDKKTINYKEALIFAFLGVLRIRNEVNALKSVTGAYQDSCTGIIIEAVT